MTEPAPVVDRVLRELDALPARSSTAVEVLWHIDDPRISAQRLSEVVTRDEALTTRMMRMANASYYGLSGRVTSAAFAVTVLGFDTVRAIAASAAAGVTQDTVPAWMLRQASVAAAAGGVIAPLVGRAASEGTSLGLLHNLGSMLLHRADPDRHRALSARAAATTATLHELEREQFGAPGYALAAAVLARWSFPAPFAEALLAQGDDHAGSGAPLADVIVAAVAVADELRDPDVDEVVRARRRRDMARGRAGPEVLRMVGEVEDALAPA